MLTALIASRGMGETVLQLAEKVMRNVAAYHQMAGPLVGWWYGVKAKLTAATTAEEVMAVVVYPPIGGRWDYVVGGQTQSAHDCMTSARSVSRSVR